MHKWRTTRARTPRRFLSGPGAVTRARETAKLKTKRIYVTRGKRGLGAKGEERTPSRPSIGDLPGKLLCSFD